MKPHPRARRPKPRHPIGTRVETHRGPGTVVVNTWIDEPMSLSASPAGWLTTVEVEGGETFSLWEGILKEIKP